LKTHTTERRGPCCTIRNCRPGDRSPTKFAAEKASRPQIVGRLMKRCRKHLQLSPCNWLARWHGTGWADSSPLLKGMVVEYSPNANLEQNSFSEHH